MGQAATKKSGRGRPAGSTKKKSKAKASPKKKPSTKESELTRGKFVFTYDGLCLLPSGTFGHPTPQDPPFIIDDARDAGKFQTLVQSFLRGEVLENDFVEQVSSLNLTLPFGEVPIELIEAALQPLSAVMRPSYEIDINDQNKIYSYLAPREQAVSLKQAVRSASEHYKALIRGKLERVKAIKKEQLRIAIEAKKEKARALRDEQKAFIARLKDIRKRAEAAIKDAGKDLGDIVRRESGELSLSEKGFKAFQKQVRQLL